VIVLGMNAYHGDSAACVVVDGKLVAAAEEERFRRIKHWAGFPKEAINYCLREARIDLGDVECVAINRDPKANLWRKFRYAMVQHPERALLWDRARNAKRWLTVKEVLAQVSPGQRFRGQVHYVEHHLAHLASAFLVSPFDIAAILSVDGFGDFASTCWGFGQGSRIKPEGRIFFPHSLGVFYQAMTQYLGFPHFGDEYKVMGLAPYGEPKCIEAMREILIVEPDGSFRLNLDFFKHHRESVAYTWEDCSPSVGPLFSEALEELLGPARKSGDALTQHHRDLARSVQATYEEAFYSLLNRLHQKYQVDALALAGGCAMNSVANGKVYTHTPFKRVYIQSAAGDAGGAIGAAFIAWHSLGNPVRTFAMDHAYWGPSFEEREVVAAFSERKSELESSQFRLTRIDDEDGLCRRVACAIANGRVVGWFQGRMEWGPRALGNRSILCDPRRPDIKQILNDKIKRRESFRPFAPSILREAVEEWFETDDEVPFMMKVFQIRENKRHQIPAVTHVDGSGRLQTVRRESNSLYYRLIEAFRDVTGVPMLLNTSFNENEPVVCDPRQAVDCFLRTGMDVLVVGNFLVERLGTEPDVAVVYPSQVSE
jgi:carbamoyltransferase